MNGAFRADVESRGRVQSAGGDEHGRHADQRVEGGDKFRHRGHRHAPGDHGADSAADGDGNDDEHPGNRARGRMRRERGGDRNRHADHAEKIAPPAGRRMREAA